MTSIAVLGSTGMLGTDLTKYFSRNSIKILEINRSGTPILPLNEYFEFDILQDPIQKLISRLSGVEYFINCSGLIKHRIDVNNNASVQEAIQINSLFPLELTNQATKSGMKILQIGTDCIFSGERGNYLESDIRDPKDVYGMTKHLGESHSPQLMILRTSIIGKERTGKLSFLEWVLSQKPNARVNGFKNHLWNGLSTLHFAKITLGIIQEDAFKSGTFHLVPEDFTSKSKMILLAMREFGREDIQITEIDAPESINRVLSTKFPEENQRLWELAGYSKPITIERIFLEYAAWVQEEGL